MHDVYFNFRGLLNMEVIVVLMVIALSVVFRVFIISQWDRDRINDDAKSKGWVVSSIVWEPFGPGWFGEKQADCT